MRSTALFPTLLAVAILAGAGCQSPVERPGPAAAVVYADAGAESRTWFLQPLVAGTAPRPLGLPGTLGNLRTAPAAGLAAATLGAESGGAAELRLWRLGAETPAAGRRLAAEWAWDFSLSSDGTAIAWVAGAPARQLWVARAPNWLPSTPVVPAGMEPGDPSWIDAQRVVVVLRRGETREMAVLNVADGTLATRYRPAAGTTLSDAVPVVGSEDLLVVESGDGDASGRLLRLAAGTTTPRVVAEGFFRPRTLRVSPDGRYIGVVTGADANALRRGEAAFRWIGAPWPGLPTVVLGVTTVEWSADGRHLFVARETGGRRWLEAYDVRNPGIAIPLGAPAASATSPQPWLVAP